jgi:MAF protein
MAPLPAPQFILASASPRRRQLFALTGWPFATATAAVDEAPHPGEAPEALVVRLAASKARTVAAESPGPAWVLAADTVVVDDGRALGKPADARQALEMLGSLRGRRHQVITALALVDPISGRQLSEICRSDVPMREYSPAEARAFVARGEAADKAGSYAIQDPAFRPVDLERMQDCYANVVGLPLCHLLRAMRRVGVEPPRDVPRACQSHTSYTCPAYPSILEGRA